MKVGDVVVPRPGTRRRQGITLTAPPTAGVVVSIDKETWTNVVYEVLIDGGIETFVAQPASYAQLKAYEERVFSRDA